MSEKIERIKKHFRDNKKVYVVAGITATVSVAATVVVMKCREVPVSVTSVQKGYTVTGDVHNTINQIVEIGISRPGNKSFVVQCIEDGRVWPSIRAAAKDMGVHPNKIASHLKGAVDDIAGMHFEKVAEV
jgi:hypothetical protein